MLSPYQLNQFMDYLSLLLKWNRRLNLTALRSVQEIIPKHFLDSLLPLPYIPQGAKLLDVGSGAGFPGLPIKILRPLQPLTLLESSAKKNSFLKEVIRRLSLAAVDVRQAYLGKGSSFRPNDDLFDIIITRAVGKPLELLSAAHPYLKTGGRVLLMQGCKGSARIQEMESQIVRRGFQLNPPLVLTLPDLEQKRVLLFLEKG
ncbi:MAG: 16S rRNA (guanine(527)-N(7))-methyltransferase RsmG [Thermodesulfobacteriota bacterium]